jgi:hypothetical protein
MRLFDQPLFPRRRVSRSEPSRAAALAVRIGQRGRLAGQLQGPIFDPLMNFFGAMCCRRRSASGHRSRPAECFTKPTKNHPVRTSASSIVNLSMVLPAV